VRRAALVAVLALAGCGGGNDEEASGLLERGFSTDVDTGVLTLDAEVELEGGPVEGPFRLELEGPFRAADSPTQLPDLDMAFSASGAGQEYEGRAILTRQNAWIEYGGATYEVGEQLWMRLRAALEEQSRGEPETFAEAGVDPLDWVEDAEESGEEEVGGTTVTTVTGRIDPEEMLRDFERLPGGQPIPESALDQVDDVLDDIEFEAWIGEDDIWRRLSADAEFRIPEDERESAGGVESVSVSMEVRLDDPNEPVEIEGLAGGRPLEELLRRLGVPPEALLGPGFAQPAPG
jgi:hypothetical protein